MSSCDNKVATIATWATEHRRCGRPQADLGHPESDIATDEAIHRSTGCEIAQNVLCGARLVGCGEEWKACDEAFVSGGRGIGLGAVLAADRDCSKR
jgi:hypothetical protein